MTQHTAEMLATIVGEQVNKEIEPIDFNDFLAQGHTNRDIERIFLVTACAAQIDGSDAAQIDRPTFEQQCITKTQQFLYGNIAHAIHCEKSRDLRQRIALFGDAQEHLASLVAAQQLLVKKPF